METHTRTTGNNELTPNVLNPVLQGVSAGVTGLIKGGNPYFAIVEDSEHPVNYYTFSVAAYYSLPDPPIDLEIENRILGSYETGFEVVCTIACLRPTSDPVALYMGFGSVIFDFDPGPIENIPLTIRYHDDEVSYNRIIPVPAEKGYEPKKPTNPVRCNFQISYKQENDFSSIVPYPLLSAKFIKTGSKLPLLVVDAIIAVSRNVAPYCEAYDPIHVGEKKVLPIMILTPELVLENIKIFRLTMPLLGKKYSDVDWVFLYGDIDISGPSRGTVYAPQKPPGDPDLM